MAISFPSNPTPGQVFLPPGSSIGYTWTGTFWNQGVVAFTPTGSLEIVVSYVDGDVVNGEVASASLATTALTASYLIGATPSASWASSSLSASYVLTAQTASFVDTARTASYVVTALTASYYNLAATYSQAYTASYIQTAQTASFVNLARSASYVSSSNTVITENLQVFGTASIKYLNTEFESSSVIFSSGSTKFGDEFVDVHELTGSVGITGSLQVNKSNVILTSQTSSMSVSDANTASFVDTARTASFVAASNVVGTVANASSAATSVSASYAPTNITYGTGNLTATSNIGSTFTNLATFTLPTAGVYKITYIVRVSFNVANTGIGTIFLRNSNNDQLYGSNILPQYYMPAGYQTTSTNVTIVTTTGNNESWKITGWSDTANLMNVISDGNGWSKYIWEKIA